MHSVPVALSDVLGVNSRYCLPGRPAEPVAPALLASIKAIGLMEPIVVHEVTPGHAHVVAGFVRCAALREVGETHIACRFLPADTDPGEIMRFYYQAHRARIMQSVVNRVRYLQLVERVGVAADSICERFLPLVGFDAHDRLLRRCRAVAGLPEPVLRFGHEKNLSMKQCVHLTRHPGELLERLFQWREGLALTASLVSELAEHIKDYLRAGGLSAAEFAQLPSIRAILSSDQSPQERTRDLRRVVREMRFPILTETRNALEAIKGSMGMPREVEVSWDPALEQRAVELRIRLRDGSDWPKLLARLNDQGTEQGLNALLQRL